LEMNEKIEKMKVFLPNEDIDSRIRKLIRSFRKQMDGEVSEQMDKRGVHYRLNFGVSLVALREKAKSLPRDVEFADRLWHRGIRETMILATLIVHEEKMTIEMSQEWAALIDNCELVEQASLNVFGKMSCADELVGQWLKEDDAYKRALAYYTLGWMARFVGVSDELRQRGLSRVKSETGNDDVFCLYRGMTHFVRQLLRIDDDAKKECEDVIHKFEVEKNKNLLWVAEELKNEMEFM